VQRGYRAVICPGILPDFNALHTERPHQEKGNVILFPSGQAKSPEGAIECRERLGGLLKYYHRQVT
jgi:hypothetical protein